MQVSGFRVVLWRWFSVSSTILNVSRCQLIAGHQGFSSLGRQFEFHSSWQSTPNFRMAKHSKQYVRCQLLSLNARLIALIPADLREKSKGHHKKTTRHANGLPSPKESEGTPKERRAPKQKPKEHLGVKEGRPKEGPRPLEDTEGSPRLQ